MSKGCCWKPSNQAGTNQPCCFFPNSQDSTYKIVNSSRKGASLFFTVVLLVCSQHISQHINIHWPFDVLEAQKICACYWSKLWARAAHNNIFILIADKPNEDNILVNPWCNRLQQHMQYLHSIFELQMWLSGWSCNLCSLIYISCQFGAFYSASADFSLDRLVSHVGNGFSTIYSKRLVAAVSLSQYCGYSAHLYIERDW